MDIIMRMFGWLFVKPPITPSIGVYCSSFISTDVLNTTSIINMNKQYTQSYIDSTSTNLTSEINTL